jgi:hypothetical protein
MMRKLGKQTRTAVMIALIVIAIAVAIIRID